MDIQNKQDDNGLDYICIIYMLGFIIGFIYAWIKQVLDDFKKGQ